MSDFKASRPQVLLCAGDVRWEAAWRRGDPAAPMVRLATLAECRARWDAAPASVAVIELAAFDPSDALALLAERKFRELGLAIVVGNASLDASRFEIMECGAALVISRERYLLEACRAARRHLKRWNPPELSVRERVWSTLPWEA